MAIYTVYMQLQIVSDSWQRPHHAFKNNQRHRIRRECAQEAGHESPPVSLPPALAINRPSSLLPPLEFALSVFKGTAHRVRHEALLHHVRGVRREPEDLRRQTARPEVDRGRRHVGGVLHPARQDVVGSPPEEEERAEEDRSAETSVETGNAMCAELLRLVTIQIDQGGRARTILCVQSIGPLYMRLDLSAAYWI